MPPDAEGAGKQMGGTGEKGAAERCLLGRPLDRPRDGEAKQMVHWSSHHWLCKPSWNWRGRGEHRWRKVKLPPPLKGERDAESPPEPDLE